MGLNLHNSDLTPIFDIINQKKKEIMKRTYFNFIKNTETGVFNELQKIKAEKVDVITIDSFTYLVANTYACDSSIQIPQALVPFAFRCETADAILDRDRNYLVELLNKGEFGQTNLDPQSDFPDYLTPLIKGVVERDLYPKAHRGYVTSQTIFATELGEIGVRHISKYGGYPLPHQTLTFYIP